MDAPGNAVPAVAPVVFDRECGGWLAVTPDDAALRVGVTGDTEEEVRSLFEQTMNRWRAALEQRPA